MSAILADGNVLIALTVVDHVHHRVAIEWFNEVHPDLATCPITEGALLRFLMREGKLAHDAMSVLDKIRSQSWHHFWPDVVEYNRSHMAGVIGHRQVTDAYLVALARHHASQLVTLDKGLAVLHRQDVHLLRA